MGARVEPIDDALVADDLRRPLQRPELHGDLLDDDADVEREVLEHGVVVLMPWLEVEGDAVAGDGAAADGVVVVPKAGVVVAPKVLLPNVGCVC